MSDSSNRPTTRRRDLLRTAATAGTLSLAALAGCGSTGEGDGEGEEDGSGEEGESEEGDESEDALSAAAGPTDE